MARTTKKDRVLALLAQQPMSLHEICSHFNDTASYSYLRSMVCKLNAKGEIAVHDIIQTPIGGSGGTRDSYVYKLSDGFVEEHIRIPDCSKGGRPRNKLLTDKEMTADDRRRLMLSKMPLFNLYYGSPLTE